MKAFEIGPTLPSALSHTPGTSRLLVGLNLDQAKEEGNVLTSTKQRCEQAACKTIGI
jgi:hypothetical protein